MTTYMNPEIIFDIYKPHTNKGNKLKKLLSNHIPILKSNKLITNREPVLVQSKNGIYIEIFEWKSNDAIEEAHENPEIQKLWNVDSHSSGVYFVKMIAGSYISTQKLMLVK